MTITPEYADRHGWMLDTSSVPWLAYRGPRWAPYATAHVTPVTPAMRWKAVQSAVLGALAATGT